jgi:hypothetical protein
MSDDGPSFEWREGYVFSLTLGKLEERYQVKVTWPNGDIWQLSRHKREGYTLQDFRREMLPVIKNTLAFKTMG